jgi:hypothetical protein
MVEHSFNRGLKRDIEAFELLLARLRYAQKRNILPCEGTIDGFLYINVPQSSRVSLLDQIISKAASIQATSTQYGVFV